MPRQIILLLVLLSLCACRSTRTVTTDKPATTTTTKGTTAAAEQAAAYKARVLTAAQRTGCLTAKVKFQLTGNAVGSLGDMTVNGNLRMKRDDVVQLSLRALGFEVGRLEFSPQDVLLIDRMGKRYVRAKYADVSFLRQAGLDFHAVQALFWNELFLPGTPQTEEALAHFAVEKAKSLTLLRAEGAGRLAYTFHTLTTNARVARVEVQPQQSASATQGHFVWTYDQFGQVAGSLFPAQMSCTVTLGTKQAGFNLSLSNFGTEDGWDAHATVSSKYKEQDANALFRQILGM